MSEKKVLRLVVLADGLDPVELSRALLALGVRSSNIHVSKDALTPQLAIMGVECDLPSGRLVVQNEAGEGVYQRPRDGRGWVP